MEGLHENNGDKIMDEKSVISVPISRNDRFYFTRKYDPTVIVPLLVEAKVLSRTIRDIPILPNIVSQLNDELIRRSIFGTAAIEGNPLSEEEVAEISSRQENITTTRRAELEITNLKKAYDYVKSLAVPDPPLLITEELIQRIHALITASIDDEHNTPGQYRQEKRKVGDKDHGGTYVPPKLHKDITLLMREFCGLINSDEMKNDDPIVRAAAAHYHLGLIHPFSDGNGRTARLVEALILHLSGIKYTPVMLSNYYYQNIDDYYWAFSRARKHPEKEITPFLEFMLKGFIDSCEKIRERLSGIIRKFTLENYFYFSRKEKYITRRQYDLLMMLHDNPGKAVTVFDIHHDVPYSVLYRGKSERTVGRDVKKLLQNKMVQAVEPGKYRLNIYVLEQSLEQPSINDS